ncbi:MAG: hypothetical protein OXU45_01130 [Candidatus Melainabacteria bacterium]|nr:hypothetical protein [Candidatus Melainabacteria bacterium]
MTVASNQPTIAKKVEMAILPERNSTRYAVVKRNFDGIDAPEKRKNLIEQLEILESDPRNITNFLRSDKRKEDREAVKLLGQMIRSTDKVVASKAKRVFVQYLEHSTTRENLMGSTIDPENPTKAEAAFETLCEFIDQPDDATKLDQAKVIANSCGFLYRQDGDDTTSTSIKRGKIQEQGKAGRDTRLFNFFKNMQKTESGKLLHNLAVEEGLQEMHNDLYSAHIAGTETGLSNQVKRSAVQQKKVTSYALNPALIWGDKSFVNQVKPANSDEIDFLEGFKKSADFSFSIAELENRFVENEDERKALVLDFTTAFELLSFRKAALIKMGRASDDPVLNRAAKRIEKEQVKMLEALQQHAGRDKEVAQAIEDMFKSQGTSIFMYHMNGTLGAAEKSVSTLIDKEARELVKDYGADSTKLASGKVLTDSFTDLTQLQKDTEKDIEKQSVSLANEALSDMSRPQLIDTKEVESFERWGADIILSSEVSNESKASTADQERWAKIKKAHSTQELSYFGLDAAGENFKKQLDTNTDLEYAKDNFERIYGMSPDQMIDLVKAEEVIHASGTESASLIRNAEDFGKAFAKVAKLARERNAHKPKSFDMAHAVTAAPFFSSMNDIIIGEHSLKPEQLIAKIVNQDTKAHQKAGFGEDSIGQLERLILSEAEDSEVRQSERILGTLELERRILASNESDEDKKNTIEFLHHRILKETDFKIGDLNDYQNKLNSALGTGATKYKAVIAENSPTKLASLLKARYKYDDLSISNGNVSRTVMGFMRRETDLLIKGFEGNFPAGMFSSGETNMLETISGMRDKIRAALEADTMEAEADALHEVVETFDKAGFPVNELFPSGSIEDGTWRDHFVFSDALFHSPDANHSDIIQVLIEIWNKILGTIATKN